MEFLRRLIKQSRSHMSGLSVSQRTAILLCVVVIIGAMVWLLQWSTKAELVSLISTDLTPEQLGRIQQKLDDYNATYQVRDNRIYVKSDERALWMARLAEQQALPGDLTMGFEEVIEKQSPFLSMEQQQWQRTVALGHELARVLRRWSGVAEATVMIDRMTKRPLGRSPIVPTASVSVRMKPGAPFDHTKAYAMASFVASAVAGLTVENVKVTDGVNLRVFDFASPDSPGPYDDLDDRRRKEDYFKQRLAEVLPIAGIMIGVHAELDPEAMKTEKTTYGKPVKTSEKTETTEQERGSSGASPGVVSNTSVATGGSGTAEKLTKSSGTEEYVGAVDKTTVLSDRMRHGLKSLRASISVPRSYLVAIAQQDKPDAKPTDNDLKPIIDREVARIAKLAKPLLTTDDPAKPPEVEVDWYYDDAMTTSAAVATASGMPAELMGWVREYGGPAGLGALAIVSLLMMLMVVRRSSEGPVLPGEEPPKPLPSGRRRKKRGDPDDDDEDEEPADIWVSSAPIGEAAVSEGLLVGKEVDEADVRSQQFVKQVTQMVEDDPETAATLIKRWVDEAK